jgi:hypothetical protein
MRSLWIRLKAWVAKTFFKKKYTLLTFEPVYTDRNQVIHPLVVQGPKELNYTINIRAASQLSREKLIMLAFEHLQGKLAVPKEAEQTLKDQ